jgi:hypothetical protein
MCHCSRQVSLHSFLGMLLVLLCTCSGGSSSDDTPVPTVNRAPLITSLTADPLFVLSAQSCTLTVVAWDPDGDTLSYSWSATAGTLTGTGSVVTWQAPGAAGTCDIAVTVSDGRLSDLGSVTLTVGTPEGWLSGTYSVAGFEHDLSNSGHLAVTGTITFDGSGGYTGAVTVNADGTIEPQALGAAYTVTAAGDVTLEDGTGGTLSGGLDATHGMLVVTRVTSTLNPLIVVAVKRSGTYTQDTVSGDYHVAAYHWDGGGDTPAYAALTGGGTFDSSTGLFTFSATNNWGGTINQVSATWAYQVSADGDVTLSDPAGPPILFKGGAKAGGDIVVGASVDAGGKPMMLVAIRKAGTFAASTMSGPHRTVSIGPSAAGASTWTGERVFDGVDAWTADGTLNDSGTVAATSFSGTYSISVDGHMTMSMTPMVFMAGVGEAGQAAAGAVVTGGQAPRFVFSVKK